MSAVDTYGRPRYMGKIHRMILKALPGTDAEISEEIGYSPTRVTTARCDLVHLGLVEQNGWKENAAGRKVKVWRGVDGAD